MCCIHKHRHDATNLASSVVLLRMPPALSTCSSALNPASLHKWRTRVAGCLWMRWTGGLFPGAFPIGRLYGYYSHPMRQHGTCGGDGHVPSRVYLGAGDEHEETEETEARRLQGMMVKRHFECQGPCQAQTTG